MSISISMSAVGESRLRSAIQGLGSHSREEVQGVEFSIAETPRGPQATSAVLLQCVRRQVGALARSQGAFLVR